MNNNLLKINAANALDLIETAHLRDALTLLRPIVAAIQSGAIVFKEGGAS